MSVDMVKRYRNGAGRGLFAYGPRVGGESAWPYLPREGVVLTLMPPSSEYQTRYGADPWFAFPWTPEQIAEEDDDDEPIMCEYHPDNAAVGATRGPYDAGGGIDGWCYCPECLTPEEDVILLHLDPRAAVWLWQSTPPRWNS